MICIISLMTKIYNNLEAIMTKKQLDKILKDHQKWLNGEPNGRRADLSGADLSGADLSGADLSGANLYGANLYRANLSEANLYGANLSGAYLYGANLRGANLSRIDLSRANLYRADLYGADLSGANLSGANLRGADLSRADLRGADLRGADLSRIDLSRANLYRANLYGANLSEVNLSGANLRWANLYGAKGDLESIFHNFRVTPETGPFVGFKKCIDKDENEFIVTLEVPNDAQRINAISSRKIRVSKAKVIKIEDLNGKEIKDKNLILTGKNYKGIDYKLNETVYPNSFDNSILTECSNGIHLFLTKQEAIEW
jgi:uncharacterized protein YjbI with pentapeptide repeats